MNFQPPKPEERRIYIDGISVIKSSAIALQPLRKLPVLAREPVLAHRVIRLSQAAKANRLGLPAPHYTKASLAEMKLYMATSPILRSTSSRLKNYVSLAAGRAKKLTHAVTNKNWYAFVPAMYKKYHADTGVMLNNTFKGHGATLAVAALALTIVTLFPLTTSNTPPATISTKSVSVASTAVFSTTVSAAQDVAEAISNANRETAATYDVKSVEQPIAAVQPIIQEQPPVDQPIEAHQDPAPVQNAVPAPAAEPIAVTEPAAAQPSQSSVQASEGTEQPASPAAPVLESSPVVTPAANSGSTPTTPVQPTGPTSGGSSTASPSGSTSNTVPQTAHSTVSS